MAVRVISAALALGAAEGARIIIRLC